MAIEEMFTQLPTTGAATMSDVICAVQGYVSPASPGLSVQETLQQVYNLFQSNIILYNSGDPNGSVAGTTYQFCWDLVNKVLYVCTTSGTSSTAVWTRANINSGYTTTATAAGTTTLTIFSTYWQFFTGSTTQTVVMPVASTLAEGMSWAIVNNSSGAVTVQSSGLNTIVTLAAGETAILTCILNSGTGTSSWNALVSAAGGGVISITGTAHQIIASASTGAVTLSTPQDIDTVSTPTFANLKLSGNTAYAIIAGGTTTANPLQSLSTGTSGQLLQSGGSAALPTWTTPTFPSGSAAAGKILRSDGTNWVASTATFADTYAASTLLYSNGSNTVTGLATANSAALVTNSTGVPAWSSTMTNGQLIIGSTGSTPTAAALTAGTGVSISNGAGSITVSAAASVPNSFVTDSGTATPAANAITISGSSTGLTTTGSGSTVGMTGTLAVNHGGTGLASYTVNGVLYASGATTLTQFSPVNSAVHVTNASGVPAYSSTMTNGQLIIGSTGGTPTAATLTAGANISITNGAGSITITGTGLAGFSWTTVSGTSQTMSSNNGYIANNAGLVTLTLPASSVVGDEIDIIGKGAGGWKVQCGGGQTIVVGSSTTTSGGSVSSTNAKDAFYMICTAANTEWTVGSAPQSAGLTIA